MGGGGAEPDGVVIGPRRGNGDGAQTLPEAFSRDREGTEAARLSSEGMATAGEGVASPEGEAGAGSIGTAGGVKGSRGERRREVPLTERVGFEALRNILPEGGDGLEMDVERLKSLRSQANQARCQRKYGRCV